MVLFFLWTLRSSSVLVLINELLDTVFFFCSLVNAVYEVKCMFA